MIEGSRPSAEMPGFIPPQLATLKLKPPAGDQWIHEIKYDGYRLRKLVDKVGNSAAAVRQELERQQLEKMVREELK